MPRGVQEEDESDFHHQSMDTKHSPEEALVFCPTKENRVVVGGICCVE